MNEKVQTTSGQAYAYQDVFPSHMAEQATAEGEQTYPEQSEPTAQEAARKQQVARYVSDVMTW